MTRISIFASALAVFLLTATPDRLSGATRHALIVATRDYPDASQLPSLVGTNRDAQRIGQMLMRGGFSEENVHLVLDDAVDPRHKPTRQNVLDQLDRLLADVGKDDLVLVMLTGHGVALKGVSYVCPADATDEALRDTNAAQSTLIAVPDIAKRMSNNKQSARKLLVVDACRDASNRRCLGFVQPLEVPPEGVWLMSSCSKDQFSYMSDDLRDGEPHAVFSYFLAEGLAGAADLLGNNDGEISLFELFSFVYPRTNEEVRRQGKRQMPELFGGSVPPFTIAKIASFVPDRVPTTSDPDIERRQSAVLLADHGIRVIQSAETRFRQQYRSLIDSRNDATGNFRLYQDHHNQVCYALGNYLKAALQLDPGCRIAHLARGFSFRVCGMYRAALEEFELAEDHLDLYVKGDERSVRRYLAHENGRQLRTKDQQPILDAKPVALVSKELGNVLLYEQPQAKAPPMLRVPKHSKVRVSRVAGENDQWLYVTAVNDVILAAGGWIRGGDVHWFPEAADMYTPASPMNGSSGSTALSKLDLAANHISDVANSLDLATQSINQLAAPFDNAAAQISHAGQMVGQPIAQVNGVIGQINSIAGLFGGGIPYVPNYPAHYANVASDYVQRPGNYIRTAGSYASIPAGYVRTAAGYVEMPSNYMGGTRGWALAGDDYFWGDSRSRAANTQRESMLKTKLLDPVQEKLILIGTLPWQVKEAAKEKEKDQVAALASHAGDSVSD